MKPNIRWQLLFAGMGLALVFALLSYHVQNESRLCSERFPASGGTFVEGILGAPQFINPLLVEDNPVDRQLSDLIFDGLTRYQDGELVPALAAQWEISEDGRTVRFELRDGVVWHDGEPFTADDVAFTYALMQDEEFPGDSARQRLWQSVDIRVISPLLIEFELREPYAGFLDATTTGILPAHLLSGETAQELLEWNFNRNPVGTGPFSMPAGQDWEAGGMLRITPFPKAWPQGARINDIAFRFYGTEPELVEAFQRGEIQAINDVSPAMLPDVIRLPETRLFSAPAPRYTSLLFNMGEKGSEATRSIEIRRALANALDREVVIDRSLNGQGVAHIGPFLPPSWAYHPEMLTLYGSEPLSATVTLDDAGWLLPEGAERREKDGNPLILRFLVFDTPTNRAIAEEIEVQWAEIGVAPVMSLFSEWGDFRQALASGEFDVALVDVEQTGDPDLYDFWSQEAIIRGQNYAGWNRRRASEALEDGRRVWDVSEREPYYDAFLRYYDEDLPELAMFQHIYTYAVDASVEGIAIGRIDDARDRYVSLANWIMAYQDITVICPEEQV
jgi:peptide/nickel transport system substrate-binding protein